MSYKASPIAVANGGTGSTTASAAKTALGVIGSSYASKSSAYTIVAGDSGAVIDCNASSAAFTVTLPSSTGNSAFICTIRKNDSSANAVTVLGAGADTVNGAASIALSSQYQTALLLNNANGSWSALVYSTGGGGGGNATQIQGTNVSITSLTSGNLLKYNGSAWVNSNLAAGDIPTIANTQVSGLGTMSTQSATGVAITGGAINGTTIGGTTPSTVAATTLTTTGAAIFGGYVQPASIATGSLPTASTVTGAIAFNSTITNLAFSDGTAWVPIASNATTRITANTTITAKAGRYQTFLVDASGGAVTMTLPSAASSTNSTIRIKKVDSSANTVTIARAGSDTIDGATSAVISSQYDAFDLAADSANTFWGIY